MTYRDLMAEKANRPPDWNKWRLMPEARLWQCVALSMNIDPDKVNTDDVSWRGVRTLFNGESQEFRDRQDMACANAGEDGALRPADYGESPDFYSVSLREFAAWVPIGWESPPELLAMADEEAANAASASRDELETDATPRTAAFNDMDGLEWREVSMMFIEPERVRITARGVVKTCTYEAMGFKNRVKRDGSPNKCWETLRILAIVSTTTRTFSDLLPNNTDLRKRISRLRKALKKFFGIMGDPIPKGYEPAFNLTAEEHVIQNTRERLFANDDEDEEDIASIMQHRLVGSASV